MNENFFTVNMNDIKKTKKRLILLSVLNIANVCFLAGCADEAVVVPVPALEGDESCTADPCKPVSKRKQNLTVQRSE